MNDELDELELTGQRGYLAFDGQGNKLGGSRTGDPRSKAILAAERRRQQQGRMIPPGGVRLGGTSNISLEKAFSPAQMAAQAAERRIRDQMWCGGSQQQDEPEASTPSSSSGSPTVIVIPDDDDDAILGQKRGRKDTSPPLSKKPNTSVDVPEPVIPVGWACAACTFENTGLVLACALCFTAKPASGPSKALWACSQCTLYNEPSTSMCSACNFLR